MTNAPPALPLDPKPLSGRVVLITGGAQGIGRGIAHAVLGAGGSVLIGDLDAQAGRACLKEMDAGESARFVQLDAAREPSVRRFVKQALQHFGRVDGVVNNAGLPNPQSGPLQDLALADWNRWLATSLGGAFLCSKHALPALREAASDDAASAIVNIASTRAYQSESDSEAYAASKGGLVAFTHALAISAGPAVRVNCISPGWIATEAWHKPEERKTPNLRKVDHAQHPAGRVGTPADIGALAVYLLSPAAGFVTGQDFIADGGMSRKMQYA